MPHAALCVSGLLVMVKGETTMFVSMPHAALCVSGHTEGEVSDIKFYVSMPHAALCVSGLCVPQPLSRAG